MEAIVILSIYLLATSAIVGAIFWLSQLYWALERSNTSKASMIEMLERYQQTNVLLIAKKSMGTPERIYDQERENNA